MANQITINATGLSVTDNAADLVGFHGATPVAKRAGSAQAAVGAQTGYVRVADLKPIFFTGNNGAGAIAATGLAVGDLVLRVINHTDLTDVAASFETTITVADQIQQTSATNLSAKKIAAFVVSPNNTTDVAALKTLVNELRAALVEKGIIKGAA